MDQQEHITFFAEHQPIIDAYKKLKTELQGDTDSLMELVFSISYRGLNHEEYPQVKQHKLLANEKFSFVGFIAVKNEIFCVLPKFYNIKKLNYQTKIEKAKFLRKIIDRYKNKKGIKAKGILEDARTSEPTELEISLRILEDYHEHGLLKVIHSIYKTDDRFEINWDKTINSVYPVISKGIPYYFESIHSADATDSDNIIVKLHKWAIIHAASVAEVFLDSSPDLDFDYEKIEINASNHSYYLDQLDMFLATNYKDRDIFVAGLIKMLIQDEKRCGLSPFQLYGVNKFEKVWEDSVVQYYGAARNTSDFSKYKGSEWKVSKLRQLKHRPKIITRPPAPIRFVQDPYTYLCITGSKGEPDGFVQIRDTLVHPHNLDAILIDAKYYLIDIKGSSINGAPGFPDITKQLFYELWLKQASASKIDRFFNYFVFPRPYSQTEIPVSVEYNNISGVKIIKCIFIDPEEVFRNYLTGKTGTVKDLQNL